MRYAPVIWLVFFMAFQQNLFAQTPGQRVRVTAPHYRLSQAVGRVLSATQDSLVVEFSWVQSVHFRQETAFDTIALARSALDRLDVSLSHGRRTGHGAVLGFGVGALTGFVAGAATYQACQPQGSFGLNCLMTPTSATEQGVYVGLTLGLVGAGLGAIIGSTIRWEKWQDVAGPSAGVFIRPAQGRGVAVGMHFAL